MQGPEEDSFQDFYAAEIGPVLAQLGARPFLTLMTDRSPNTYPGQPVSAETVFVTLTRFESEEWGISPGQASQVFETSLGVIGAAICYDSEFPLLVRSQIAQGAELVLVPSCTDTLAGYYRVALSCRARARPQAGGASPVLDANPRRWRRPGPRSARGRARVLRSRACRRPAQR